MNKPLVLFEIVFIVLFTNLALAADLTVKKTDLGSTVVKELNNPAFFEFNITNPEDGETSEIYSLVSVTMLPKEPFFLPEGNSTLSVSAVPNPDFRERSPGLINFEYQIKGEETGIFKDKLLVNLVSLKDIFEFEFSPITPGDITTEVKITSLEKAHIQNLEFNFESVFFNHQENLAFKPLEEQTLTIPLKEQIDRKLTAGPYIVTVIIPHVDEGETQYTESLNFIEKEETSISQDSSGFIIRETTSKKTNTGNIPTETEIEITKGIVGRFFTSVNPSPTKTERADFSVKYTWEKRLAPTETLVVTTTTNYTIPFIILIAIIVVALLAYRVTQKPLTLSKSVSLVRTKGGEFALKVNIRAKANKAISDVHILDRLPNMTKLFDKFGRKPDKIDHQNRRLTWNLGDLDKGEVRVFSYIIFSKINIVGRFELPPATGTFKLSGIQKEVFSNRAFFAKEETD
jgi:hypothetical protein